MRFSTGTELETPYTVQFNLGMDKADRRAAARSASTWSESQGYNLPLMHDLNPVSGSDPDRRGLYRGEHRSDRRALRGACPVTSRTRPPARSRRIVTEGQSWYTGLELN